MNKVTSKDRTTLLLDYGWRPIGVLTARACFKHFIKGRVKGIDKDRNILDFSEWYEGYATLHSDQPCLSSAKELWALPSIAIVTEKFFRKFGQKAYSFRQLCTFHNYKCQICFEQYPMSQLTIEHVKPKSKGGSNCVTNKTITCRRCNCRKGSIFPYYDTNGKELRPSQVPAGHVFIEEHDKREEWKDLL
jgi:5-methylcytosine-specific restriction endonuclease McrA